MKTNPLKMCTIPDYYQIKPDLFATFYVLFYIVLELISAKNVLFSMKICIRIFHFFREHIFVDTNLCRKQYIFAKTYYLLDVFFETTVYLRKYDPKVILDPIKMVFGYPCKWALRPKPGSN